MNKKNLISVISLIVTAAVLLSCTLLLASCSEDEVAVTAIKSAEIKDGNVKVTATLEESYAKAHSSDNVYLLALQSMDPELSLDNAAVVGEVRAKGKMSFKFSLSSGKGYSYLSSALVLAEKTSDGYAPLTKPYYVENPEELASKSAAPVSVSGIKGYLSDDVVGSNVLGGTHFLIEAEMDKLILEDYVPGAVKFDLDGVSYYYDSLEVERIDKLVSDATASSMRIYIREVLRAGDEKAPEFLYYRKSGERNGYLPDLSNDRTVRYIRAFNAFLASRYDVADFIIGEKVNGYDSYCYGGKLTNEEFEAMYSYWARLSYQMLKSVNAEAKMYISMDNTWRAEGTSGSVGAKAFLSRFASSASTQGNYPYDIAMSLGDSADYAALISGNGYDYTKLGVTNLSDMVKFLESTDMRYKSEKRKVIIDGLSIPLTIKEKDRASYYTCSYYAASENGFGAVIYSDTVYSADDKRADLYYAMLMCGTDMNSQLGDYTDTLPDAKVPAFDDHITRYLTFSQNAVTDIDKSTESNKTSLSLDPADYSASGSVFNIQGSLENGGENDYFSLIVNSLPSSASGAVAAENISADQLISSAYVGIMMNSDSPARVALRISDGERVYIGEAEVYGSEKTYYFDISKFTKNASESENISLSLCILEDTEDELTLEIRELALYGSSGNGTETTITIIIVAAVAFALVGLIVFLAIKRKKKTSSAVSDDE